MRLAMLAVVSGLCVSANVNAMENKHLSLGEVAVVAKGATNMQGALKNRCRRRFAISICAARTRTRSSRCRSSRSTRIARKRRA